MAATESTEVKVPEPDLSVPLADRPTLTVSNQLVALIMIADGNSESDILSKTMDYFNSVLTFNILLGLPIMYKRKKQTHSDQSNESNPSDDEKKNNDSDEVEYETNYVEKGSKVNNYKKESYKLLWNDKEILSFFKEVATALDDESKKYDSLIVILTSYTRDNASYMHVFPSNGDAVNLLSIYSFFYKDVCKFSNKGLPMVFIVDRYNECESVEKARELNEKYEPPFWRSLPSLHDKGEILHFYTHQIPLYAPNTSTKGGVATQSIRYLFKQGKVRNGAYNIADIIAKMSTYFTKYIRVYTNPTGYEYNYYYWKFLFKK